MALIGEKNGSPFHSIPYKAGYSSLASYVEAEGWPNGVGLLVVPTEVVSIMPAVVLVLRGLADIIIE